MRRLKLGVFLFVLGATSLGGQIRTGVVQDDRGDPLPGVSVKVEGTSAGTVTDVNGKFSVSAEDADRLIFSFIGMAEKAVAIGGKTDLGTITMTSDVEQLGEVVVAALGITRSQKAIGYGAQSVSADELTANKNSDVMSAISGKVPGLQISSSSAPGGSNAVIIRGAASLGGVNQPLYIVDGVPLVNNAVFSNKLDASYDFGNGANAINPEDVQAVTVLKGAAATALYGNRAANGAILISTKEGEAGVSKVVLNSTADLSEVSFLPQMQNKFGMGWDGHHTLIENGSWGPRFDGTIRKWGTVYNNSQKIKPYTAKPNNLKDFFDRGIRLQNSIAISGGSKDKSSKYYFSLGHVTNDGIYPTDVDRYERYTAALKVSHYFFKNLKVSSSINYSANQNSFVSAGQDGTVYGDLMQIPRDVSIISLANYKTDPFNSVGYYFTPYGVTNPYYLLDNTKNNFDQTKLYGKLELQYWIKKDIYFIYRLGLDQTYYDAKVSRPIIDAPEGTPNDGASTEFKGSTANLFNKRIEWNHQAFFNYERSLGFMGVRAIVGWEANQRSETSISAEAKELDIPDFYNLRNTSGNVSLGQYSGLNTSGAVREGPYSSLRRLVGAFVHAEIDYRGAIFLTLSARNDWSSTLPKNNNSFFYPGVALSAVFSEFLPSNIKKIVSFGKLRLAWGQTGNDAKPYQLDPYYTTASIYNPFRPLNFPVGGKNAFEYGNRLANPLLSPELTTEQELGLQMDFFGKRFGFDFSLYNRISNKQIFNLEVSPSSGFTSQTTNLGEISNQGVELLAYVRPVQNENWLWEITMNYTKNNNKLVSLPEELGNEISLGGTSAIGFVAQVGKPLGLYKATVPRRSPKGNIVVNPETGRPLEAKEKAIVGQAPHDYLLGGGTSLSYKGLTIGCDVDYRHGGLFFSRTADVNYFVGNAPQTLYNDRKPFVVPNSVNEVKNSDGDVIGYKENTTPISIVNMDDYWASGGAELDRSFILPRTFLKVRRVRVSYRLPKAWVSKTKVLRGATVSLLGYNLWIWTPLDNQFADPETSTFGNDLRGMYGEYSANPSMRYYGVNLRLTF